MADNPFQVVGSPNYAAPLVNFSPLSGQQQKPAQPQPGQPQPNQQSNAANKFGQGIRNWLMQPGQQQQPGQPMQLGSIPGANQATSGLY
jgi:hypothetical protein